MDVMTAAVPQESPNNPISPQCTPEERREAYQNKGLPLSVEVEKPQETAESKRKTDESAESPESSEKVKGNPDEQAQKVSEVPEKVEEFTESDVEVGCVLGVDNFKHGNLLLP